MSSLNRYLLSLPERVLRSASALAAGLVREIGDVALPKRIRKTVLYQTMVESTLRFLIEQVGEVENTYPLEGGQAGVAEHFVIKRAVGDGIDLAGIVAFHASPVWVLAALADLSGAGRDLLDEITSSMKEEGLLDRRASFENIDQMLDGLERTAGQLATSIRFPPLDIAGLRKEWAALRSAASTIPVGNLPSAEAVREQWEDLKADAARQDRTVFQLSSVVALATIRAVPEKMIWLSRSARSATLTTGQFFAAGLLEHYGATLQEIRHTGYMAYCAREYQPYLRAAAEQFSLSHESLTERLLERRSRRSSAPKPEVQKL
jgi:hypothetical protein